MLTYRQVFRLVLVAIALWVAATAYIRVAPESFVDPFRYDFDFIASIPVGWLSVRLIQWVGRLHAGELLAGGMIVLGVAMSIDGVVLRWLPMLYSSDDNVARLGAAWLLWGYGVSAVIIVWMDHRQRCRSACQPVP